MVYGEGTFFLWGFCIPNSRAAAYVIEKQTGSCRRSLLSQGLYVQIVKTTTYVCSRFNTSFCARDHKANQDISNLNRKFWNISTQQIKSTISLIDLCFGKKYEQEKKNLYKISISKSIYVDTFYVLFVIIVTEYNVLSNEIFCLTSQKGGGIASAD